MRFLHRRLVVAALAVWALAVACGGTGSAADDALGDLGGDALAGGDTVVSCGTAFTAYAGGLRAADPCLPDVELVLMPSIYVDGAWEATSAACEPLDDELRCPFASGTLTVTAGPEEAALHVRFEATTATELGGVGLVGRALLPGARGWLSNGFQSWSYSGYIAIGEPVSDEQLAGVLTRRGYAETSREGTELSWWYTWVGGPDYDLIAGSLGGTPFRTWVQVGREEDDLVWVRLGGGAAGDTLRIAAGETADVAAWHVRFTAADQLTEALAAYGRMVPSRRRTVDVPAAAGWNSWYEFWNTVDAEAVRDNAARVRDLLAPALPSETGPLHIVIDDGWQRAWGDWEANDKFPDGMAALAAELTGDGFVPGIWLAPLLVQEGAPVAVEHPDWLLPDTVVQHDEHGQMRVLDVSHPEAAAHLQSVIERIVGWGYHFLKIDFLFAGTYVSPRATPMTAMQSYDRALALIREAAGEDTVLLAVGCPGLPSLAYVDSWRLGGDIASGVAGPIWVAVVNQLRSLSGRWPMCVATLCDADPVLLRKLPRNEVEAGSWVVALAGGALFLSDDLRNLPAERETWGLDALRSGFALGGVPSHPSDPFGEELPEFLANPIIDALTPELLQVVPVRWTTPDGGRLLFNGQSEEIEADGQTVPARSAVWYPE